MKIKDMKNVKINNYVDFDGWDLTEKEVTDYIKNLTLDELEMDNFNTLKFIKYNEWIEIFVYNNPFNQITINIEDIY